MAKVNRFEKKVSKYRGVWYCKNTKKWKASIHKDSVKYRLGTFLKEIDAFKAYQRKYKILFSTLFFSYLINCVYLNFILNLIDYIKYKKRIYK